MEATVISIALTAGIWIANLLLAVIAKTLQKSTKQIAELHVSHLGDKATDKDGRPKWWFPSDLKEILTGIMKVQEKVIVITERQDDLMERIEVAIEKVDKINGRH